MRMLFYSETLKIVRDSFSSVHTDYNDICCYVLWPLLGMLFAENSTFGQIKNNELTTPHLKKYVFTKINAIPAILSIFTLASATYGLYKNNNTSLNCAGFCAQLTILSIGGSIIGQVIARNKRSA